MISPLTSGISRRSFGVPTQVPGKRAYHNPVDRRDILQRAAALEKRIAYLETLSRNMRDQAGRERGNPQEPQALAMQYLIELNELYRGVHGARARAFTLDHFWHPKNIQSGVEATGRIGKGTASGGKQKKGKHSKELLEITSPGLFTEDPTGERWAASVRAKLEHIKTPEQERRERRILSPSEHNEVVKRAAGAQVKTLVRWIKEKKWTDAQTMITNLKQLVVKNPQIGELNETIIEALREAQSSFSTPESNRASELLHGAILTFSPSQSTSSRAPEPAPVNVPRKGIGMRTPSKAMPRSLASRNKTASPRVGQTVPTPRVTILASILPLQLSTADNRARNLLIANALKQPSRRFIGLLRQRVDMLAAGKATIGPVETNNENAAQAEIKTTAVRTAVEVVERDMTPQGQLRERFNSRPRPTQKDMRELLAIASRAGKLYLRMSRQGKTKLARSAVRVMDDAMRAFWHLLNTPSK